jgi:hypothetical protein
LIYNVLLEKYNYQKENIIVLYSWDGNSSATIFENDLDGPTFLTNDLDGPATWDNIQQVIAEMKGEVQNPTYVLEALGHGDQLAVFFTGVPVDYSGPITAMVFPINQTEFISVPVEDIAGPMEDIDCGQMLFTFDVNSSTDVLDFFRVENGTNVKCMTRFLHGSTHSGQATHAEMYFTTAKYSEYLYYWASAARGFLPDEDEPWNYINIPLGTENGDGFPYENYIPGHPGDDFLDVNLDGFVQMGETFVYANKMDTWSDDGYCYFPWGGGSDVETPVAEDEIPFVEDLITLIGLSGIVTEDQSLPARNYIIAENLKINYDVDISFADNSEIYINRINYPVAFFEGLDNCNISFGNNTLISSKNGFSDDLSNSYIKFYGYSMAIGINSAGQSGQNNRGLLTFDI